MTDYYVIKKIFDKLDKLQKDITQLMALVTVDSAKVDAINAAVDSLTTETTKALSDIAAEITSLKNSGTADPTTSAALDSILAKVNTLNANVAAADPGPLTPNPPSVP